MITTAFSQVWDTSDSQGLIFRRLGFFKQQCDLSGNHTLKKYAELSPCACIQPQNTKKIHFIF